jgi:RNA polymerase sigma factor (sigma-70 family)
MALAASSAADVTLVPVRPGPGGTGISRRPAALVEVERELVAAAQRGGVRERQQLIKMFRPLIVKAARRYHRSAVIEFDELMQEGCVGLLEALRRYDPDLGVPFGAYARWWVWRAMQRLVSELSGPVVLSERAVRQLERVKQARRELEQKRGRRPTALEVAAACGLPRAQVEGLMAAQRAPRALQPSGSEEGRDGLHDGAELSDPGAEDAYDSAIWRLTAAELPPMLDRLAERERGVIRARYGLGCRRQTLGELAGELCVSSERVRQIEQSALRKLSAACEGERERAA